MQCYSSCSHFNCFLLHNYVTGGIKLRRNLSDIFQEMFIAIREIDGGSEFFAAVDFF